jgi:dTDP-4-amino-4,6-dideoxygalactose transaminase
MMDIQASLGIHQLPRLENYLKRREEIWHRYDDAFKQLPLDSPPPPEENTIHARHLYTILLRLEELSADRDTIQQALFEHNIGTGIHFISLHLHPYYQEHFGYKRGDFPKAAFISDRTISLPLSAKLTDEDVTDVIEAVTKVLTQYKR